MIDWNIQSRATACQACGRPFADREPYHTLLFDQKQGYERLDVCEPCWTSQYSQGANDRKGFVSHWQGEFTVPPAVRPDPILKETAETLLRKLVELNDPNDAAAGYILAVMLERKRVLKFKGEAPQETQRMLIYEHARTGEIFTIPDPNLQLNQLEEVQRHVSRLLEHGLSPPANPPPTAPDGSPAGPSEAPVVDPSPSAAAGPLAPSPNPT